MSLREALPKIVTGTLPGPKGQDIMDRRAKAVPNCLQSRNQKRRRRYVRRR